MELAKRNTRRVRIGDVTVGGEAPVVVQSMCATRTMDIDQTVAQTRQLSEAGAGIVRIALDSEKEVAALKEIRAQTRGITLSVDLQENYRVADKVAPHVDKIRYNPGHLHHIEKAKSIPEKVRWIVDVARAHDIAIRIGVNCGSVAPAFLEKHPGDQLAAIVESAVYHCELMEQFGFGRFIWESPRRDFRPTGLSRRGLRSRSCSRSRSEIRFGSRSRCRTSASTKK